MKNALEELWYGNIVPSEYNPYESPEVRDLLNLKKRNRDKISSTMTEAEKETLERYDETIAEILGIVEREQFIQGFRLGGRLMVETLADGERS